VGEIYEYAMMQEHRTSPGDPTVFDTTITDTGALATYSGLKTGRSPKEKRVVLDKKTQDVRLHP
jgi:phosphoenolpyruvate carboxykinase (ATP)